MNTAYIALGSNIYPRTIYIYSALNAIQKQTGTILKTSSIHKTEPWKMPANTAFFYNMCIKINTSLNAFQLLEKILLIEKNLGRIRQKENTDIYESRCIDMDILLFNEEIIQEKKLTIPHPYLHERSFVLLPLLEIANDLYHPVFNKKIKDFLK